MVLVLMVKQLCRYSRALQHPLLFHLTRFDPRILAIF